MSTIVEYTPEEIIEHAEHLISAARHVIDARAAKPDPYIYFTLAGVKLRIGSKSEPAELSVPKFRRGDLVRCDILSPDLDFKVDHIAQATPGGEHRYLLKYAKEGGAVLGWVTESKVTFPPAEAYPPGFR